jgi:hypothetical protein
MSESRISELGRCETGLSSHFGCPHGRFGHRSCPIHFRRRMFRAGGCSGQAEGLCREVTMTWTPVVVIHW